MKLRNLDFLNPAMLIRTTQVATCLLAAVYLAGCASPASYRKADVASESLQKASAHMTAESQAIDNTMAALDNLVNRPAPDLTPQFNRFSVTLDRLIDTSVRAEKAADEANQKSAEYFKAWDNDAATINFQAVRDQSVSRKTEVSNEFNTVNERYRENQAVVEPLISYLKDIRTALGTDLTPGGLRSVKSLADNAQQNAHKVQTALGRLSEDLASSGTQMSSVQPQNQARGGVSDPTQTTRVQADSAR